MQEYLSHKRDAKETSGVGQRNCIAQQPYFDNFSLDLEVVSCCQVNDAMIGGGCCVLCNVLNSCL